MRGGIAVVRVRTSKPGEDAAKPSASTGGPVARSHQEAEQRHGLLYVDDQEAIGLPGQRREDDERVGQEALGLRASAGRTGAATTQYEVAEEWGRRRVNGSATKVICSP